MSVAIGEVIAVRGVKITLRVFRDSNLEVVFDRGKRFKGLSIREHIAIRRGFKDIICVVEGEFLDEKMSDSSDTPAATSSYIRTVEVRPIGHLDHNGFAQGIKYLPMIKDHAFLISDDQVREILSPSDDSDPSMGTLLKEGIAFRLPWRKLLNSHIGIFGNTGSGKSNTLALMFTKLFDSMRERIGSKSKFVLVDFNGEYTSNQLTQDKAIFRLSTSGGGQDKFPLDDAEFWNLDTLAILFQATPNTQRPFLSRLIDGRARYLGNDSALTNYAKSAFKYAFSAARPKAEALDLLRELSDRFGWGQVSDALREISWHGAGRFFRARDGVYFNSEAEYLTHLDEVVALIDLRTLDSLDQLVARAHIQLTRDITSGFVQFEHIQPLLKRIDASLLSLKKVLDVGDEFNAPNNNILTVVSLKRCNSEIKKVVPLLLAKHYYNQQKDSVAQPPDKTLHLVIDEAHNILSQQSVRESESWKDYRVELFEEIIKEGRKFGCFMTIASQRPADISQTIISQLHNFFIHRLVNDRDLFLMENTITTLDSLSRAMIPNLPKGCCVVTGIGFDIPLVVQMEYLDKGARPDSDDVDLEALWRGSNEDQA